MVRQRSRGHGGIALTAVITACMALSAACGGSSANSGSGGTKEIVIGEVASLTGAYSTLGESSVGGIKTAVDQLNKAGGAVVGGTRYTFRVVAEDDQSDPSQAGLATQKLIRNDHVQFIFGPDETPEFNASVPITHQASVIQTSVSFIAGTDLQQHGAAAPYDYVFTNDVPVTSMIGRTVSAMSELWPGIRTAAILFPSDASFDLQVNALKNALQARGAAVQDVLRFDSTTKDFSAFLTRIKAHSPDLLVSGVQAAQDSAIGQQAAQIGGVAGHLLMMGGDGAQSLTLNNGRAPTFSTAWFTIGGFDRYANVPAFTAYIDNYKASNGKEPPAADYEASAYYYAPVFQLAKAMEIAGTISDTAKISRTMVSTSVPGIVGTYQYNAQHLAQVPVSVCAAGPNAAGAKDIRCAIAKS